MNEHPDQFLDRIDRYVQGKMSASELDIFEEEMLEDQNLVLAVERSELLHQSLREQAHLLTEQPSDNQIEPKADYKWLAIAACAVLGLSVMLNTVQYFDSKPNHVTFPISSEALLEQTRSSAKDHVVVIQPENSVLTIDVGPTQQDAKFGIIFEAAETEDQFRVEPLRANDGVVRVFAKAIPSGLYKVSIYTYDPRRIHRSYQLLVQ